MILRNLFSNNNVLHLHYFINWSNAFMFIKGREIHLGSHKSY